MPKRIILKADEHGQHGDSPHAGGLWRMVCGHWEAHRERGGVSRQEPNHLIAVDWTASRAARSVSFGQSFIEPLARCGMIGLDA
jgi:hypothetical protein